MGRMGLAGSCEILLASRGSRGVRLLHRVVAQSSPALRLLHVVHELAENDVVMQDVTRVGRGGTRLLGRVDEVHVGDALAQHGNERHHEHRHGAGSHEDGGDLLGHGACLNGNGRDGNDDRQRRGAVDGHRGAAAARHVARALGHGERNEDGQRPDDKQHENEAHEQRRPQRDGREVDLCSGDHEEQRDEEAMRHACELGLERLIVLGHEVVQDKAGGEGAQDEVKLKYIGKREQGHEQQHGKAHVGLRGGLSALCDPGVDFAAEAVHALGKRSDENAEEHKPDENRHTGDLSARREQQRHGNDRPQLAPGAVRKDRVAHARAHETALGHDGQQRTQGGGGEDDGDGNALDTVELGDTRRVNEGGCQAK